MERSRVREAHARAALDALLGRRPSFPEIAQGNVFRDNLMEASYEDQAGRNLHDLVGSDRNRKGLIRRQDEITADTLFGTAMPTEDGGGPSQAEGGGNITNEENDLLDKIGFPPRETAPSIDGEVVDTSGQVGSAAGERASSIEREAMEIFGQIGSPESERAPSMGEEAMAIFGQIRPPEPQPAFQTPEQIRSLQDAIAELRAEMLAESSEEEEDAAAPAPASGEDLQARIGELDSWFDRVSLGEVSGPELVVGLQAMDAEVLQSPRGIEISRRLSAMPARPDSTAVSTDVGSSVLHPQAEPESVRADELSDYQVDIGIQLSLLDPEEANVYREQTAAHNVLTGSRRGSATPANGTGSPPMPATSAAEEGLRPDPSTSAPAAALRTEEPAAPAAATVTAAPAPRSEANRDSTSAAVAAQATTTAAGRPIHPLVQHFNTVEEIPEYRRKVDIVLPERPHQVSPEARMKPFDPKPCPWAARCGLHTLTKKVTSGETEVEIDAFAVPIQHEGRIIYVEINLDEQIYTKGMLRSEGNEGEAWMAVEFDYSREQWVSPTQRAASKAAMNQAVRDELSDLLYGPGSLAADAEGLAPIIEAVTNAAKEAIHDFYESKKTYTETMKAIQDARKDIVEKAQAKRVLNEQARRDWVRIGVAVAAMTVVGLGLGIYTAVLRTNQSGGSV